MDYTVFGKDYEYTVPLINPRLSSIDEGNSVLTYDAEAIILLTEGKTALNE